MIVTSLLGQCLSALRQRDYILMSSDAPDYKESLCTKVAGHVQNCRQAGLQMGDMKLHELHEVHSLVHNQLGLVFEEENGGAIFRRVLARLRDNNGEMRHAEVINILQQPDLQAMMKQHFLEAAASLRQSGPNQPKLQTSLTEIIKVVLKHFVEAPLQKYPGCVAGVLSEQILGDGIGYYTQHVTSLFYMQHSPTPMPAAEQSYDNDDDDGEEEDYTDEDQYEDDDDDDEYDDQDVDQSTVGGAVNTSFQQPPPQVYSSPAAAAGGMSHSNSSPALGQMQGHGLVQQQHQYHEQQQHHQLQQQQHLQQQHAGGGSSLMLSPPVPSNGEAPNYHASATAGNTANASPFNGHHVAGPPPPPQHGQITPQQTPTRAGGSHIGTGGQTAQALITPLTTPTNAASLMPPPPTVSTPSGRSHSGTTAGADAGTDGTFRANPNGTPRVCIMPDPGGGPPPGKLSKPPWLQTLELDVSHMAILKVATNTLHSLLAKFAERHDDRDLKAKLDDIHTNCQSMVTPGDLIDGQRQMVVEGMRANVSKKDDLRELHKGLRAYPMQAMNFIRQRDYILQSTDTEEKKERLVKAVKELVNFKNTNGIANLEPKTADLNKLHCLIFTRLANVLDDGHVLMDKLLALDKLEPSIVKILELSKAPLEQSMKKCFQWLTNLCQDPNQCKSLSKPIEKICENFEKTMANHHQNRDPYDVAIVTTLLNQFLLGDVILAHIAHIENMVTANYPSDDANAADGTAMGGTAAPGAAGKIPDVHVRMLMEHASSISLVLHQREAKFVLDAANLEGRLVELKTTQETAAAAAKAAAAHTTVVSILGPELLTEKGTMSTSEVLADKKFVALYFGAQGVCGGNRGDFTSVLSQLYADYIEDGSSSFVAADVVVIFVSNDRDEKACTEYYQEMGAVHFNGLSLGACLPFANREAKTVLATKYGVGVPADGAAAAAKMVVVRSLGGEVVNSARAGGGASKEGGRDSNAAPGAAAGSGGGTAAVGAVLGSEASSGGGGTVEGGASTTGEAAGAVKDGGDGSSQDDNTLTLEDMLDLSISESDFELLLFRLSLRVHNKKFLYLAFTHQSGAAAQRPPACDHHAAVGVATVTATDGKKRGGGDGATTTATTSPSVLVPAEKDTVVTTATAPSANPPSSSSSAFDDDKDGRPGTKQVKGADVPASSSSSSDGLNSRTVTPPLESEDAALPATGDTGTKVVLTVRDFCANLQLLQHWTVGCPRKPSALPQSPEGGSSASGDGETTATAATESPPQPTLERKLELFVRTFLKMTGRSGAGHTAATVGLDLTGLREFLRLVLDFDVLTHDAPKKYYTRADKLDAKIGQDAGLGVDKIAEQVWDECATIVKVAGEGTGADDDGGRKTENPDVTNPARDSVKAVVVVPQESRLPPSPRFKWKGHAAAAAEGDVEVSQFSAPMVTLPDLVGIFVRRRWEGRLRPTWRKSYFGQNERLALLQATPLYRKTLADNLNGSKLSAIARLEVALQDCLEDEGMQKAPLYAYVQILLDEFAVGLKLAARNKDGKAERYYSQKAVVLYGSAGTGKKWCVRSMMEINSALGLQSKEFHSLDKLKANHMWAKEAGHFVFFHVGDDVVEPLINWLRDNAAVIKAVFVFSGSLANVDKIRVDPGLKAVGKEFRQIALKDFTSREISRVIHSKLAEKGWALAHEAQEELPKLVEKYGLKRHKLGAVENGHLVDRFVKDTVENFKQMNREEILECQEVQPVYVIRKHHFPKFLVEEKRTEQAAADTNQDENAAGGGGNGGMRQRRERIKEELRTLVGMEKGKKFLNDYIKKVENMDEAQKRENFNPEMTRILRQSRNTIITGNPGTGKTKFAQLVCRFMFAFGLVDKEQLDELDLKGESSQRRDTLSTKIIEKIKTCEGGCLILNEPYELNPNASDRLAIVGTAGEGVRTLLTNMQSTNVVILLTGDKEKMEQFMRSDANLANHFLDTSKVHLNNYTPRELVEVVRQVANESKVPLDDGISDDDSTGGGGSSRNGDDDDKAANNAAGGAGNARASKLLLQGKVSLEEKLVKLFEMDYRAEIPHRNANLARKVVHEALQRTLERGAAHGANKLMAIDFGIEDKAAALAKQHPERQKIDEELNDLVGMSAAKDYFLELRQTVEYVEKNPESRDRLEKCMNLVVTGNPGTGKTSLARLLFRFMHAYGILKKDNFVEANALDLKGEYVGQTAPKVKEMVARSMGGCLFLDEAYSLNVKGIRTDGFGSEAIRTLLTEIENNRTGLLVVLAGYQDKMNYFMDSDPGLARRFPKRIHLSDYTPEDLTQIASSYARRTSTTGLMRLADGVAEQIREQFAERPQFREDISKYNGSLAIKLVDEAVQKQSQRLNTDENADVDLLMASDFGFDVAVVDEVVDYFGHIGLIRGIDEQLSMGQYFQRLNMDENEGVAMQTLIDAKSAILIGQSDRTSAFSRYLFKFLRAHGQLTKDLILHRSIEEMVNSKDDEDAPLAGGDGNGPSPTSALCLLQDLVLQKKSVGEGKWDLSMHAERGRRASDDPTESHDSLGGGANSSGGHFGFQGFKDGLGSPAPLHNSDLLNPDGDEDELVNPEPRSRPELGPVDRVEFPVSVRHVFVEYVPSGCIVSPKVCRPPPPFSVLCWPLPDCTFK
jgi:AAA+ superfamily predicted ATPase